MKLPKGYSVYDAADYLKTERQISAYLNACFDEADGNPALIAKALGNVSRARGMTKTAKKSGLTRAGLYRALSGETNTSLATFMKVIQSLGLKLQVA